MPETNAFAERDTVIATRCLVTPDAPGQIRVEIPAGTRGTVVGVEPVIRWAPYRVVFEIGTGLVEMRVTAEKIGRVHSHEPHVPFLVEDMVADVYEPTHSQPHRLCNRLHEFIVLEGMTAYGLVLTQQPRLLLSVTALLVLTAYLHQLVFCRRFAWIPEVLLPLAPTEHEELVVNGRATRSAVVMDVAVAVSLGTLLLHHLAIRIGGDKSDVPLFIAHVAVTGLLGVLKWAEHARAAHIYPKNS